MVRSYLLPINLEGYSAQDRPTLYFSYLIEVEDDENYEPDAGGELESCSTTVCVYSDPATTASGSLLATNNDVPRMSRFSDEFDYFDDTNIVVQELFDNEGGGQWRQARVDIGPLAGSENVRIRFDFSTSGNMRVHYGSVDFVAVPGDEVVDNQELRFTHGFDDFNTIRDESLVVFETIVGRDLVFPSGAALAQVASGTPFPPSFSVVGPDGPFTVNFVAPGSVNSPTAQQGFVEFDAGMTEAEIADAVFAVLPGSLNPINKNNGTLDLLAASDVIAGTAPVAQSNPVPVSSTASTFANQFVIPVAADIAAGETLTFYEGRSDQDIDFDGIDDAIDISFFFGGETDLDFNGIIDSADATATTLTYVSSLTGAPGEVLFAATDTRDEIAQRILSQLPTSLQAVYQGDGVILFQNSTLVIGASTTQVGIDNSINVNEGRVSITPADGDNLVDGETLTLTSLTGVRTTVTFEDALFSFDPNAVLYQAGDSVAQIAARLHDVLPIEFGPLLNGNEVTVIATSVTRGEPATSVGVGPVPSQRIAVPSGPNLIDGEVLTVVTDSAAFSVPFTSVPGVVGTVHFLPTDTPADIQGKLLAVLPAALDAVVSGGDIVILGALEASSDNAASQIISTFESGQAVTLPDGAFLTEGETVTLTDSTGSATTFTFTSAPAVPTDVGFAVTDLAGDIAQNLLAAMTGFEAVLSGPVFGVDSVHFVGPAATNGAATSQVQISQGSTPDSLVRLTIPDPSLLRSGEQVQIFEDFGFFNSETITFIRRGTIIDDIGTVPIFYDDTDNAEDLYQQIIDGLGTAWGAYVDPTGNGINVSEAGFAFSTNDPILTGQLLEDVNAFAIPITIPNGADITAGEQFTVVQRDFTTSTFTLVDGSVLPLNPGDIVFNPGDTGEEIASDIVRQLPLSLRAFQANGNEVRLMNAASVVTATGSSVVSFTSVADASPILVDSTMTSTEVAAQLQVGFAEGIGRSADANSVSQATVENFKVYGGDRIRLYHTQPIAFGPFGLSQYDPSDFPLQFNFHGFPVASPLPADGFGVDQPIAIGISEVSTREAENNQVEGVYLDDIIIGFAERGEMVIDASPGQRSFTFDPSSLPDSHPQAIQPERQNEALLGGYSLEIRTSDEYGVPNDYRPNQPGVARVWR